MKLSEWLRVLRGERSQQAIADACRRELAIYQDRVSSWERGKSRPSLAQLHELLRAMDADSSAIAEGEALWRSEELACLSVPAAV